MSPAEVATRLTHFFRQRRDGLRIAFGSAPPVEPLLAEIPSAGRFFFDSSEIPDIAAELRSRLPAQASRVVEQAEKIRGGRFDLLGYEGLDFGTPIDWHLDPVSGRRAPQVPFYRVPYLDYAAVGDHKVIWELNRHQHLVTLAKAWWLCRDDGCLETLVSQWREWMESNPYGVGINWASSLEVAFRSLSWLWVLQLLPEAWPAPAEFRRDLTAELGRSARHIERYLSTYFAPNTHLLGEALALFFVGSLCPRFRSARRWRELGWKILVEQAQKQVRPDGLHFEQSVYYHVYALDFLLHARLLDLRNSAPGSTAPTALDGAIERMAGALQTLSQAGVAPRFGDDDGGRLFDGSRNRPEHLTDPLATCAALFGRADYKAACPHMPEETLWLLGVSGARKFEALTAAAPRARTEWFPESGVACIASSYPAPHVLAVDAGPQGFGNAGHGHADALSLQLIVAGHSVLADPGTCCYPVEVAERNIFRGTAAHNTLEVDSLDQAEPGGSFDWRTLPRARAERWVESRGGALLVASHDGYMRLDEPVTHRRWIASLGNGLHIVRDVATGQGVHSLCVRWHPGPEFTAENVTGGFRLAGPGQVAVRLVMAEAGGGDERRAVACRVAEGPWSDAYGRKAMARAVCCETRSALPAEFATAIVVSDAGAVVRERFESLRASPADCSVYRYRDANRWLLAFFSESGENWRWNGWSSDAAFVAIEADAAGREGCRIFVAGGSFLENAKDRVLQGKQRVDCWEWLRSRNGEQVFCSDPDAVEEPNAAALEFNLLGDGESL